MDGKSHDKITKYLTPVVGLGYGILSGDAVLGFIAGIAELFGGLYLSPDLDIKSNPWRRWGLLRSLWLPYQKLVPHRHWISHSPIVGTLGRVAYILFPSSLILGLNGKLLDAIDLLQANPAIVCATLLGIELSVIAHLIADYFPKLK